jgi:hypothetical protein
MKIDQKIETEMGTVVFRGELTDEEVSYVMQVGLVTMFLRGELDTTTMTSDGTIISDVPENMQ